MALDNLDEVPLFCCDNEYVVVEDMVGEFDLCLLLPPSVGVLEEGGELEVAEDKFIGAIPASLPTPPLLPLLAVFPPLRLLSPPNLPLSNRVTSK